MSHLHYLFYVTQTRPTSSPVVDSDSGTFRPTQSPSQSRVPIPANTFPPSTSPSTAPTTEPSQTPSQTPSRSPSKMPSASPSSSPSQAPTGLPSKEVSSFCLLCCDVSSLSLDWGYLILTAAIISQYPWLSSSLSSSYHLSHHSPHRVQANLPHGIQA